MTVRKKPALQSACSRPSPLRACTLTGISLARALRRIGFPLSLLLLWLWLLLLCLRLGLRFFDWRGEITDTFERHTRRCREDRLRIRHTLTARTSTRGRRYRWASHTNVIHIEQIVFVAADQTGASRDEHVVPVFTRIEKTRMRWTRPTRQQIDTSTAFSAFPGTGALPLIHVLDVVGVLRHETFNGHEEHPRTIRGNPPRLIHVRAVRHRQHAQLPRRGGGGALQRACSGVVDLDMFRRLTYGFRNFAHHEHNAVTVGSDLSQWGRHIRDQR